MSAIYAENVEEGRHLNDTSDNLIAYLAAHGIDTVFCVPGGAIEPILNAIARYQRRATFHLVVARHETEAAFMAQGYATETRKIGVCLATTGPGATNLITGVASAFQDECPLLVITGQTHPRYAGLGALQDSSTGGVDITDMFSSICRFNALITDVAQVYPYLQIALQKSQEGPCGPVHISIPPTILRAAIPRWDQKSSTLLNRSFGTTESELDTLSKLIEESTGIAIYIGQFAGKQAEKMVALAEMLRCGFVTAPGAKGLVDPFHPYYQGVYGFAGHRQAIECLHDEKINTILAFSTSITEWDAVGWDDVGLRSNKVVHIDETAEHVYRSINAKSRLIINDLNSFLSGALQRQQQSREYNCRQQNIDMSGKVWNKRFTRFYTFAKNQNGVHPIQLMKWLSSQLPPRTRFFADAGNSTSWAIHHLHYTHATASQCWFQMSAQFAAMGWAIGASIGCAIAQRDDLVVCITGDGSLLMNGQELSVAIEHRLKLLMVVLNDSSLGMVKHGQRMGNAEAIGYGLPRVDFSAIARAMGAKSVKVERESDLYGKALQTHLDNIEGPLLIDVTIDGEAVPPMQMRVQTLGESA